MSDLQGGTAEDLQTAAESQPPIVSQKPASKLRKSLSPIQETSVETNSLTSLGGCSPLEEEQEEVDHAPPPGKTGWTFHCAPPGLYVGVSMLASIRVLSILIPILLIK